MTVLKSMREKSPIDLQPLSHAYPTKKSLQPKHYQTHLVGTTYAYNFPELFSKAIQNVWIKATSQESMTSKKSSIYLRPAQKLTEK